MIGDRRNNLRDWQNFFNPQDSVMGIMGDQVISLHQANKLIREALAECEETTVDGDGKTTDHTKTYKAKLVDFREVK